MASTTRRRMPFFPKADAAVLSSKHEPPPTRPQTVGPIFDPDNADRPIRPWPHDAEHAFYPRKTEAYGLEPIPDRPMCASDRYLRAFLAKDERLRLSMLWYYTRDILKEAEFLSGLQEKAHLAKEATEWEFAVIGILDVNFYIRLATVGLPLCIIPRGEVICAHTVTQPPGSVFHLPNMMEDWRFENSPYVEMGGLHAYAGAPLRLQTESGDCVGLGSLCVASGTKQEPLNKLQQQTIARLADWVVSDIVQCARARRQRERRRMAELIATAQKELDNTVSEDSVLNVMRTIYPDAIISLKSSKTDHVEIEGRSPILLSDLEDGLWEDVDYLDDFIANSNHLSLPLNRVVRVIATKCDSISGQSMLVVASKDFRLVFDDIDSWFVQTCADMLSQMWHKILLAEVMKAKEKFLRGISHQLRTPIHGILGSVELLAEELKLRNLRDASYPVSALIEATSAINAGESSLYLNTIKTSGRDLISIVNSMITLNRWADIAMSDRCYAIHTVHELEAELGNELRQAISGDSRYKASVFFNHDLPPDCDSLRVDLNLLRDSLLPLIMNAIQNTPEGAVMVTTSIRLDSKELVVDVEDTGCGIHPDHQQQIFEPYEKVSPHSTGAGLGLAIASKFATLLHGSVDLISSEVDQGSHFRATFREVEFESSPLVPRPLVRRLKNLPSKFHHISSGPDRVSVCEHFTRYLTCHGFTSSDSTEDCFNILDFVPDLEQHQTYLSKIPSEQVAICLIPASEREVPLEQAPNNVVYVNGPFLTSTMNSALEEADRLLSVIKASRVSQLRLEEPLTVLPKIDEGPSTNGGAESLVDSPKSKGSPVQSPTDNLVDSGLDIVAPTCHSDPAAAVELGAVDSIFPGLARSPKPTALLVDDNLVNLRIMQMYCRKRGVPYHCATDGAQAVEMFSQHQASAAQGKGAAIELILMDLQMPVCDGIEATRQIRSLEKRNGWGESVLFIVTGQDSPKDRTDAEGAGADEYFVKPVSIKVLDVGVKHHFPAFETN